MQTKLVYVLTCAPETTYIEQALISIFSARYHNPSAYIVLLVDDLTDKLLVDQRAAILEYITEKVVLQFANDSSMMYRSRFIKTQVRKLIKGDILFIDCDTIINHSLSELDNLCCEVGAVLESNLPIDNFCQSLYTPVCEYAKKVGWNPTGEKYYFSSGVIYAKDTINAHELFDKWHQYWLKGLGNDVKIDQPSLAKANIECNHLIQPIDNKWNCIMFTYPRLAKDAYILHYASYRNMSFLFTKRVLNYIKNNGLTEYIKTYILDSTNSYIPFKSNFYHYNFSDYYKRYKLLLKGIKDYSLNIDDSFIDYKPKNIVYKLLKNKFYKLAIITLLILSFKNVRLNKNYKYTENICSR